MERIGQIDLFVVFYPSTMTPFTNFPQQNDILAWLIEVFDGNECTVREITAWILITNFVSVHTSTMARKSIITRDGFAYLCRRPLRIHYTIWQLVQNMYSHYVKKLKQ